MSAEISMLPEVMDTSAHNKFVLDNAANANDGRVMFYRGELFLSEEEMSKVNELLSVNPVGKVQLIEVKTPPLIPSLYTPPLPVMPVFTALPPRSTRGSVPGVMFSSGNGAGKLAPSERPSHNPEPKRERSSSSLIESLPSSAPRSGGKTTPTEHYELPRIKSNRSKVQSIIREAYISISTDPDYRCLESAYIPEGFSPPATMTSIRTRIEAETYEDHFQFMNDLIGMATYWLQGPPTPNPMLPQYMASLKLSRNGTDVMMNLVGEISNDDYYEGPDVDEVIKIEARREAQEMKSRPAPSSGTSPSYARKVRRTDSSGGNTNSQKGNASKELKQIQDQVTMLTEHVLGLQNTSSKPASKRSSESGEPSARPLSPDEIRKLETDLMRLSAEDIDHVVSNILKDEPSVRVDDESYELDVAALPATKQRNLRRFVSRRLNIRDPSFGAQKLKQLLKDDERAKASEEFAERLLAAGPTSAAAPIAPIVPRMSPEEEEAERLRIQREQQREEEAKRLWQLAHGDDMDDD